MNKHHSKESRRKISKNNARYWLGKTRSEETKKKISESNKGRKLSEEHKKKISKNSGRYWLGKHLSEDTKEKLRKANLGRRLSEETKKKISKAKKSVIITWGYKISLAKKGVPLKESTKEKLRQANLGKKLSEETKKKISTALSGHRNWSKKWSKERTEYMSKLMSGSNNPATRKDVKKKISKSIRKNIKIFGYRNSPKTIEKIRQKAILQTSSKQWRKEHSEKIKKKWEDEKWVRNYWKDRNVKPNKSEKLLYSIIQDILPNEYELNTKAEIMILGGKIPDYVNVNGKKKVIELYGSYFHNPKYFPNGQSESERIDYFKKLGWGCLVIWESELKDVDRVKEKILEFNKK